MGLCMSSNAVAAADGAVVNKKKAIADFFMFKYAAVYSPMVMKSQLFKLLAKKFRLVEIILYVNKMGPMPIMSLQEMSEKTMPAYKAYFKSRTDTEEILICATFNYYFSAALYELSALESDFKRMAKSEQYMAANRKVVENIMLRECS